MSLLINRNAHELLNYDIHLIFSILLLTELWGKFLLKKMNK